MSILNQEIPPHTHRSGFEWGAVIAGSIIACAISIVLLTFGSAIGLADDAPLRGEANLAAWSVIATGIWLLWVQLLASFAGGYTAGYLRTPTPSYSAHENELHNGLYGFATWATSTVLVFIGMALAAAVTALVMVQPEADTGMTNTMTDTEQNTAIIFAFVTGATALLSAVAAWWAATMGGEHRALGTDFSHYISFKAKQK
jgi:preprotein translocase subunit SecG